MMSVPAIVTIPSHNNNDDANTSGQCVSAHIRISTSIFGTEMEDGSCPCDIYLSCGNRPLRSSSCSSNGITSYCRVYDLFTTTHIRHDSATDNNTRCNFNNDDEDNGMNRRHNGCDDENPLSYGVCNPKTWHRSFQPKLDFRRPILIIAYSTIRRAAWSLFASVATARQCNVCKTRTKRIMMSST
jgi:hypothetical protein